MRESSVVAAVLSVCLMIAWGPVAMARDAGVAGCIEIAARSKAKGQGTYLNREQASGETAPSGSPDATTPQDPTAKILGHWSGEFQLANANGRKYTVIIAYYIYSDPQEPAKIRFKEADSLRFLEPQVAFSCTGTNFYSNSFEGEVAIDGDTVKFLQKRVSNPDCGGLSVDTYRFKGDVLEAVRVDEGKITSGFLRRV
jgi:hypothetical protein